jgi:hypothetical protein
VDDPALILLFAIRSDEYGTEKWETAFEGLRQETLPLSRMPRADYQQIIARPARRVERAGRKLAIDPMLSERLLADIEAGGGGDALPLLSFTLEQLWREFHANGALRLADYEATGGLGGAIGKAVERAFARADQDGRIPRERTARENLLRLGLIPWLAGIDPDTKRPRRNIARQSDIPEAARPLINLLVEERLLSTDTQVERIEGAETRIDTIEPAHEALLRQWGLVAGWLREDF